jgi:protein phosphatase
MNNSLYLGYGSKTNNGLVKEFNTDSIIEFEIPNGHVFVVCDGHDGPDGHGALASKLTTESIKKYFFNRSYKDIIKALTNAITFANITLFEQTKKDSKYNGIGSTIAILIYFNKNIYYAYAGDSRIYVLRDDELQPLTRDHVNNPDNPIDDEVNIFIGKDKNIKFGVCKKPLTANVNDVYMLCTDGLTDKLTKDDIVEVLSDKDKSSEHKCLDLIDLANEKGGEDCVSVQVIDFSEKITKPKIKKTLKTKYIILGILSIVIASVIGFFEFNDDLSQKEEVVVEEQSDIIQEPEISDKLVVEEPTIEEDIEQDNSVDEKEKNEEVNNIEDNQEVFYNHKIKYGENLYRIAIRYNTTQLKLIEINGDRAKRLVAGTTIKIPVKAIHTVQSGESFSSISDKYKIKIRAICVANKLEKENPLKLGQKLIIPLSK